MKRKGFKLHFLVAATVIFSLLLTLLVSSTAGYQSNKEALINNSLELNGINAKKAADTTNDLLASAKKTMAVAAKQIGTASVHQDHVHLLRLIKESSHMFNSVFVTDDTGIVVATLPENLGTTGKKLESDAIKVALSQRVPLISEPYTGITGRYIILVSHPIFDENGSFLGVLGGSIYLNEPNVFEVLLNSEENSTAGSYIYVVSKQGELLYHPNKSRIGEQVSANSAVSTVLTGAQGEKEVNNTVGKRMLAGYAPVGEVGWGVVSQTPYSQIKEASNKLILKILLYSAPLILLIIIAVILLTRYISSPLYKLASFAEAITIDGQSNLKVPSGHSWNYEANELRKTIEQAVLFMQNQISALSLEAHKDTLTGLNNRRTMDRVLQEWQRRKLSFSYIIVDIDHFKSVNDTFGHHVGDAVLQFLAAKMMESARADDVCCRYGGEEFVILSPGADVRNAYQLAETIRQSLESTPSPTGQCISISAGIAAADEHSLLEETKQMADAALYQSKHNGRNRSTIAAQSNTPSLL